MRVSSSTMGPKSSYLNFQTPFFFYFYDNVMTLTSHVHALWIHIVLPPLRPSILPKQHKILIGLHENLYTTAR